MMCVMCSNEEVDLVSRCRYRCRQCKHYFDVVPKEKPEVFIDESTAHKEYLRRVHDKKLDRYNPNALVYLTVKDLETVEEKVAWLLNKYSECRDSDKLLITRYWRDIDKASGDIFDNIDKITSPESIRRCRQKLQNKYGLFKPSEGVRAARKDNEETYKEYAIDE